jgi:hypothetical protein
LWNNTIQLSQYNGRNNDDLNYIIQRRKNRFEEDEEWFNCYGYYYLKKDVEPIINGQNKKYYSEPREYRSETEDSECEWQTIYHHSNVDQSLGAADTKVELKTLNGRQSRIVEGISNSTDGKICLTSETSPKILIEEAYHYNTFREIFSISPMKSLKLKLFNQRRLGTEGLKCYVQTFKNNSAVGERSLTAVTRVSSRKTNGRQNLITECTHDSVYCKTCLE